MPSSASGRRRVRCPKCTVILTEPQSPIYECPVCSTYLLAKGHGLSKTSDKSLPIDEGDAEEAQKITDEGAKPEKASLSNDDGEPLQGKNVNNLEFEREIDHQSYNHALLQPNSQTLAKHGLSNSGYIPSEFLSNTNPEKSGDLSPIHPSTQHPSSDLGSDSCFESEADSPLWSPDAKTREVSPVSLCVNGLEDSSVVPSSNELMSSSCTERPSEETMAGKDAKNGDKPQGLAHEERCIEEINVDKEGDSDKQQSFVRHDHLTEKSVDKNEVVGDYITTVDDSDSRIASKVASGTALSSFLAKGTVKGEDLQINGDCKEKTLKGKFQLFDLSVFGIYNEETYNKLQRGKVADYPSPAENGVDGDNIEPPDGNELVSKLPSVALQGLSSNKESSEAIIDKVMLHSEKITSVSELPVPNTVAIDTGTGDNCETQVTASYENTGTGSLDSSAREVESVAFRSMGDEILRTVSDAIAKTQYGDNLGAIEPSSESTSVDISFGDWRSQPVPKFSNNVLELDSENAEHDKGMTNSAAEEDADSPWNDNEELSLSSTAKGGFKAERIYGSPVVARDGNDEDQAKSTMDKPAFPLRTTAMQKLVKRDDQQVASRTQLSVSVIKSESALYEAPHVALPLAPVPKENALSIRELESRSEALELEHPENETDPQRQSIPDAHGLPSSSTNTPDILPTSVYREEDRRQASHTDHPGSRKSFEVEASSQEDRMLLKMHNTRLETVDLNSQNVDYFNQPKLNRQENPTALVSLKPKGKGSNIRSSSSTEDEGPYGMESHGVNILEEDSMRLELIGRPFPRREGVNGSRQQSSDLAGSAFQPAWIGTNEANHRRIGSGEPATSRRTVRSRLPNSEVSNQGPLMEEDRVHADEKSYDSEPSEWIGLGNLTGKESFDSETPGWMGLGKLADQPNVNLGSGLNVNSRRPDQMSHHVSLDNISTDYSSDRLSHSQDITSHSRRNDYLRDHHGLMSNVSAMAYAYHSPPYGSAALTAAHEEVLSRQSHVHRGISPACSICIQQQYFLQHPQMHQNMMLHQCAACAVQASVAHQPIHHEMHGHHAHDMMHLNHPIGHTDSIAWSADSIRQNNSRLQQNHVNMSARRMKRHPPLPGEGAPPYVLCRHCNQLLLVPKYLLAAASGSVQRLHCGACGKISKFSISQPHNHAPWSSRISSDRDDFVKMDKQHMDMARVYSSGQNSSNEFVSPAHKPLGKVRHIPGKGTDQVWIENRVASPSNAHEISLMQPNLAGRPNQKKPPATIGSGQAAYGSRHTNGKHAFNDTGPFIEDYSSSPSSASGASPERLSQLSQDNQAPAPVTGRTNRDHKYSLDLASSQTLVHDQRTSYPRAPSFSDGVSQIGVMANPSRVSQTSLQGSTLKHFGDRPHFVHLERHTKDSRSGSRHNEHADGNYFGLNSPRSHLEQGRKVAVSPGSPVVVRFTHDGAVNDLPYAQQKQLQKGNGSRSAPRSPKSEYEVAFPQNPYSNTHSRGRSFEDDRPPRLPLHDGVKGPTFFAGLLKRSIKDRGKGGQGGGNRRKVIVNGYLISEAAVRKAEEQAGPIHSGTYWYDYQAGFWGVLGGPCMGILMPFIEEFNFPLARDCASGRTGILVNGRELHDEDLEVLAKRGLPTIPGKAYILDISGALFDDVSGRSLKGLGKLAPTIEKRGRGYGMSTSTPMGW